MTRDEPPLMSERLLVDGQWWGSPVILLRGSAPSTCHLTGEDPGVGKIVAQAKAALPGEQVKFGRPRWDRDGRAVCELPIGGVNGWDRQSADVDLVSYAYAESGAEEWRAVEHPGVKSTKFLVGLRDGEPVAIIAPRSRMAERAQP